MSKLDPNFSDIFGILDKRARMGGWGRGGGGGGGLTPKGKIAKPT